MVKVATGANAVLADTSILISHLRGHNSSQSAFERAVETVGRVCVSSISIYEVEYGAARARRASDVERLLDRLNVLSIDHAIAFRAAHIHAELIRTNQDIGLRDVLIAATGIAHSLPVLTSNLAHFQRIPDLQVIDAATI